MALLQLTLLLLASAVYALDNGLGVSPAMGWNTWNSYACDISEDIILGAARAIKRHKLDDYGYTYVNIDDCWQAAERDAKGAPQANTEKFPNGIKDVADKVNAMGLKLGIYSDAGKYTCGGKFGSLGHETIDAQTYAEWGIEYLKYDNCFNEGNSGTPQISAQRYQKMTDALNATGKPILYSMCSWGEDYVWNWASTVANSWRISGDIYDNFNRPDDRCPCQTSAEVCHLAGYHCSVMNIIEKAAGLGQKARAGAYNDLDMLEVGNGGMTHDEYVTHFSIWAFVKSPLILGNIVTNMTNQTLDIITNKHIIALNQDKSYNAGYRIWKRNTTQLWKTNLENNTFGMLILNSGNSKTQINVDLEDFFIDECGQELHDLGWKLYDLWDDASLYKTIDDGSGHQVSVDVASHGVKVFKMVNSTSSRTRVEL